MITDDVWRALIMWPEPVEMGTYLTPEACVDAATYFATLVDVLVLCFKVVAS
jgi:hypothetical protein